MRVFVTGASGHIGGAVLTELVGAGHQVLGLARSDTGAAKVADLGAEVLRSDLDDLDALGRAAAESDGVIHLAFRHDWMRTGDFNAAVESDLQAIQAMGRALEGTDKPFVTTSGTLMLAFGGITGRPGTEADVITGLPRTEAEAYTIELAQRGVRSSAVRLPPTVHSDLDHHGFVPTLIEFARAHGHAGYVGDGSNRWPAVDTRDAARVYRLALESAPAGTRLHAVAEEGIQFRQIAEAIGQGLGVPVQSVGETDVDEYFGFLARFVGADGPISSTVTRQLLGWAPERPGLLEDLGQEHYFTAPTAA